ncbi:hypothetical protein ACQP3J_31120, partial [Escherichia coli]
YEIGLCPHQLFGDLEIDSVKKEIQSNGFPYLAIFRVTSWWPSMLKDVQQGCGLGVLFGRPGLYYVV